MPDFLFYGDSERSAALRHELPVAIGDPFLLAIVDGRLHVMSNSLERERIAAAAPGAILHDIEEHGFYELLDSGLALHELELELTSRIARAMGVTEAVADPQMPVAVADRLRADGIALQPDHAAVTRRRRVKSDAELTGIRRAQLAADAGMAAAAALLARARPAGDELRVDGEILTAEAVRAALREACAERGAPAPPSVIVSSLRSGGGHEPGSGPLPAGLPIVVDLWPRDEVTACWADMTRTFVVGAVPPRVRELAATVRAALEQARAAVAPGITGRELHAIACDVIEAAGHRTQRTGPGEDPDEGFQFSLGHGVGLDVHEEPSLGRAGGEPLVAGDVVAIEPGIWTREVGEVRLEDLLLVTPGGSETLTRHPYGLAP